MQVHYLEVVTPDVEAVCAAYAAAHGVEFGGPDAGLGGARTARMTEGGHRAAVDAAVKAGAVVAHPPLEIPGHGTFAIYIQGGVHHGLWQK